MTFRHPAPARLDPHRALFGVTPQFDSAHDQLLFERRLLDAPMRRRDDALSELLRRYAAPAVNAPFATRERQRTSRSPRCNSGLDPGVASLARELGVSARSLQRSLSSEGTSYAEIAARTAPRSRRALVATTRTRHRRSRLRARLQRPFGISPCVSYAGRGSTPGDFRSRQLGGAFVEPVQGRLGPRSAAE